jgi:hypothetical protein
MEAFDWTFNPKTFDRVQLEELATGDFIRRKANLMMVGWSGIGKSHIIQALGQKACVHGYRVLYRTSAQLLTDLTASLADKTLPARLRYYANPDWLIIDEFGFDKIERAECPEAAHLLYKIIASRNQKRSTAVVTNVDFDKWGDYLSDDPLAMAFLDRLVEGAIILKVKGKSYREGEVLGKPFRLKTAPVHICAVAPAMGHRVTTSLAPFPAIMAPFFGATVRPVRLRPATGTPLASSASTGCCETDPTDAATERSAQAWV